MNWCRFKGDAHHRDNGFTFYQLDYYNDLNYSSEFKIERIIESYKNDTLDDIIFTSHRRDRLYEEKAICTYIIKGEVEHIFCSRGEVNKLETIINPFKAKNKTIKIIYTCKRDTLDEYSLQLMSEFRIVEVGDEYISFIDGAYYGILGTVFKGSWEYDFLLLEYNLKFINNG